MGQYSLILGGTGSVEGSNIRYMMEPGQFRAVLGYLVVLGQ